MCTTLSGLIPSICILAVTAMATWVLNTLSSGKRTESLSTKCMSAYSAATPTVIFLSPIIESMRSASFEAQAAWAHKAATTAVASRCHRQVPCL